jgi:hypothetical protein
MNKKQNNTTPKLYNKKIVNWHEYNQSMINRGNVTLLIDNAMQTDDLTYRGTPAEHCRHKPGRRFAYSDQLILLVALFRELYHLPLRQASGFAEGIFELTHLDMVAPNYTTLCRRLKHITVPLGAKSYNPSQPLVILIDSTGLKIMGEGEWTVRKHGRSYARDWRKVHLAVDYASRDILAVTTTEADAHDVNGLEPLLNQCDRLGVDVSTVIGDGAYDSGPAHAATQRHGSTLISPPRVNAKTHPNDDRFRTRDDYIWSIRDLGLDVWKDEIGYHRRSLVETTMYRLKQAFSGSLRSRTKSNQVAEARLRVNLLNYFTGLGLPKYAECAEYAEYEPV